MGERIEKVLLAKFPDEVERVWTRTGTPEVATDPMGVELSDVFVTLRPREHWKRARTQAELVEAMRKELEGLPGERLAFTQPIEMRVNEMVAGVRSDLGVKLFGDDLDLLRAKAREIETVAARDPGRRGRDGGAGHRSARAAGHGRSRRHRPVRRSRRGACSTSSRRSGSATSGEIREGERRFALGVRLAEDVPASPTRSAPCACRARPASGSRSRGSLTIEEHSGPTTIQREWGKRRVVVQANVHGRDLGSFVAEAAEGDRASGSSCPRATSSASAASSRTWSVRARGSSSWCRSRSRWCSSSSTLSSGRLLDTLRIFSGVPFALVGGDSRALACAGCRSRSRRRSDSWRSSASPC